MRKKIGIATEASNRDKVKEKFEEASRQAHQESKALAIIKFETAMQSMVQRNVKDATIKALANVKKPLFHNELAKYLKSDGSFRSIDSLSIEPQSPAKKGSKKR